MPLEEVGWALYDTAVNVFGDEPCAEPAKSNNEPVIDTDALCPPALDRESVTL